MPRRLQLHGHLAHGGDAPLGQKWSTWRSPLERPKEVEPHIQIPPLRGILDAVVTRGTRPGLGLEDGWRLGARGHLPRPVSPWAPGDRVHLPGPRGLPQRRRVHPHPRALLGREDEDRRCADLEGRHRGGRPLHLPDVQSLGLATLNRTWMAMKNARKGHLHGRPFEQRGLLTGACSGDHGNSLCPFLDVCEGRLDILDDLYFTDHDPNARYQPDGGEI